MVFLNNKEIKSIQFDTGKNSVFYAKMHKTKLVAIIPAFVVNYQYFNSKVKK
jgi:hypothetical protein